MPKKYVDKFFKNPDKAVAYRLNFHNLVYGYGDDCGAEYYHGHCFNTTG